MPSVKTSTALWGRSKTISRFINDENIGNCSPSRMQITENDRQLVILAFKFNSCSLVHVNHFTLAPSCGQTMQLSPQPLGLNTSWKNNRYLISCALLLRLQASSHHRVDSDSPIKWGGWKQGWIPGAPLDVKTPLVRCWKLVNYLKRRITREDLWLCH